MAGGDPLFDANGDPLFDAAGDPLFELEGGGGCCCGEFRVFIRCEDDGPTPYKILEEDAASYPDVYAVAGVCIKLGGTTDEGPVNPPPTDEPYEDCAECLIEHPPVECDCEWFEVYHVTGTVHVNPAAVGGGAPHPTFDPFDVEIDCLVFYSALFGSPPTALEASCTGFDGAWTSDLIPYDDPNHPSIDTAYQVTLLAVGGSPWDVTLSISGICEGSVQNFTPESKVCHPTSAFADGLTATPSDGACYDWSFTATVS
jgi:hypothetical protein